jgi:hypothetical protein
MISFKNLQKAILIAGIAGVMAGSAGLASAQTPAHDSNWEKTHPRRDEVNDRLANQNKRIKKEVWQASTTATSPRPRKHN